MTALTQYILIGSGAACLIAALVLVLWPRFVAAVPAFCGMVLLHLSYLIMVPTQYLLFWGIATAMVAGLAYISPRGEPDGKRSSNIYIGLGAISGALLGIIVGPRILVLGVILGALMGQLMYSRTPHGRWLNPASRSFWQYFAAKCLPVIVAVAITGISVEGFLLPTTINM
ncbi:MAG: hypothetical protein MJZ74_08860 [Muribaculaceae bacterium]|nr:hypothetical protein [Muribaculaceae bacterium]